MVHSDTSILRGAEHDERAPYNQPSYDDCPECAGEGRIKCWLGATGVPNESFFEECDECHGTGELRPLTREEIAIEKADRDMDAAKDEPRERDL